MRTRSASTGRAPVWNASPPRTETTSSSWPRTLTPGYYDAVVAVWRDAGVEPRLGDAASGATVWGNIAAGRGVGLVVGSFAEQAPRGITLVPLRDPTPALIFDLIWATDHDGPTLQRLRDAATLAARRWKWVAGAATGTASSLA